LFKNFSVVFIPQDKKDEEEEKPEAISFWAVYRYADKVDYALLAIGITLCLAQVILFK
jgi:hypothetical protein